MAMLNNQMVCFFEKGIWWYPWLPYFWLLVSIVYKGWGSVSQAEIISPWCWPIGTPHLFVSKNNWLVVWNHGILWLSIYWECHHPNWRTHIFQRGRYTMVYHQPDKMCQRVFLQNGTHQQVHKLHSVAHMLTVPGLTALQVTATVERAVSVLEKAPPADLVSFEAERCLKMFEVFRLDMDKGLGEPLRNWMIFKLSRSFTFTYSWLCLTVWRVFFCFPIGNPSFQGRFCCVFLKQFKYCAFFLDVFGLLLESSGGFNLVDPLMFLGQEESKGSGRPSFIVFKNDLLSGYQSTRNNCIDHTYPGIWIHMYTLYTIENMEMGLSRKTMENHLASV